MSLSSRTVCVCASVWCVYGYFVVPTIVLCLAQFPASIHTHTRSHTHAHTGSQTCGVAPDCTLRSVGARLRGSRSLSSLSSLDGPVNSGAVKGVTGGATEVPTLLDRFDNVRIPSLSTTPTSPSPLSARPASARRRSTSELKTILEHKTYARPLSSKQQAAAGGATNAHYATTSGSGATGTHTHPPSHTHAHPHAPHGYGSPGGYYHAPSRSGRARRMYASDESDEENSDSDVEHQLYGSPPHHRTHMHTLTHNPTGRSGSTPSTPPHGTAPHSHTFTPSPTRALSSGALASASHSTRMDPPTPSLDHPFIELVWASSYVPTHPPRHGVSRVPGDQGPPKFGAKPRPRFWVSSGMFPQAFHVGFKRPLEVTRVDMVCMGQPQVRMQVHEHQISEEQGQWMEIEGEEVVLSVEEESGHVLKAHRFGVQLSAEAATGITLHFSAAVDPFCTVQDLAFCVDGSLAGRRSSGTGSAGLEPGPGPGGR